MELFVHCPEPDLKRFELFRNRYAVHMVLHIDNRNHCRMEYVACQCRYGYDTELIRIKIQVLCMIYVFLRNPTESCSKIGSQLQNDEVGCLKQRRPGKSLFDELFDVFLNRLLLDLTHSR